MYSQERKARYFIEMVEEKWVWKCLDEESLEPTELEQIIIKLQADNPLSIIRMAVNSLFERGWEEYSEGGKSRHFRLAPYVEK